MVRDGTCGRRHPISQSEEHREALRQLRARMRGARRAVPPLPRLRASTAVARRVARLPAFRRARDVGLYVRNDGELDPAPLEAAARMLGKRIWLPVVRPDGGMEFARVRAGRPARRNRFGIPEPASVRRERRPARRLDFVLVPLVAFDRSGRRLGMGGGFYDRALSGERRPFLAGVAFALQEVPELPARPWDIPMDVIVTERGLVRTAAR